MYKCVGKVKSLSFMLVLLAVILSVSSVGAAAMAAHSAGQPKERRLIILDAGHGGVDPGAIGVNKVKEKDINLAITLCLRDILTANGYEVLLTRDSDTATNDQKYKQIGQLKTSDLKNRLKLFNKHKTALVVSIHQNEFTSSSSSGAQMFYGKNNEDSKLLAEAIQQAFRGNLQPNNKRVVKRSTSDVYIVHNAKNPIVLAECGFVSNPTECRMLSDSEYQQKVAFTIFCGIINFIGQSQQK